MNRFRPYLRRHLGSWAFGALATAGAVALNVYIPRLLGEAIDDLRSGAPPGARVPALALRLVAAAALSSGLAILMRRVQGETSRRVGYELRRDLFERLTLLDPAYFYRTRTGDLMNRFTGDLNAVQETLGFGLTQLLNTVFVFAFTLAMMLRMSARLSLVVLCVFPLIILVLWRLLREVARRYARVQEEQSRIAAKAQENFSGARVVKGYAMEERELGEYRRLNEGYRRSVLGLARVEAPLWATVGLLMNIAFVLVLVLGSRLLLAGGAVAGLTLGGFVTFVTYLFQLNWPMLSVGIISNIFQRGRVSWGRLAEVLSARPAIEDGPQTDFSIRELKGDVRFERVTLELSGRTLLNDVSLHIPEGTTLGVTGRTGSGKTLLGALLTRQVEATSGRVLIDGHDVRTLPLAVLRGAFGVVMQEPFLFSDTLAANIGFGLPESLDPDRDPAPPPDVVAWASTVAGLAADAESFPERYETVLGERGVTLSGGQRQRTALARALAKRPRLLVLDDAMSAVDTETESRILSHLKGALAGRTVVLIGHRVSTLRHADRIVVLEQGRVVEEGTHEELLMRKGRYAELDRRQRLERALEEESAAGARPAAEGA